MREDPIPTQTVQAFRSYSALVSEAGFLKLTCFLISCRSILKFRFFQEDWSTMFARSVCCISLAFPTKISVSLCFLRFATVFLSNINHLNLQSISQIIDMCLITVVTNGQADPFRPQTGFPGFANKWLEKERREHHD